jgi:ribosome-binding factor A
MMISSISLFYSAVVLLLWIAAPCILSFQTVPFIARRQSNTQFTLLNMAYKTQGRSSPRISGRQDRSKRQERVGHLVRTELSTILHRGVIKGDADYLEDELRQRISVIHADVSPDLRQARITVSIRKGLDSGNPAAVDKRRAFSWLVQNTKAIRHSLAQNLKHMKSVPNLTFAQADVAAAVDVMYLIDKVAEGYKRESVGEFGGDDDSLPRGMVGGIDFDEDDDVEWIDEDEAFFEKDSSSQ